MSALPARRRALVIGVANERSLAWSIAQHLHQAGMEIGLTYQGPALERRVRPLAESIRAAFLEPCDLALDADLDRVFATVGKEWGALDVLIHSVAFADIEELDRPFVETSREGFRTALDISAYSLIGLARRAVPLMAGGSILTLTHHGSERVMPNYHVMGVAKAALESAVRYLAADLGPKKIRVNAISAGPVKTFAAMAIRDFDAMLDLAEKRSPLRSNITGADVGALAAFLCGESACRITGSTLHVDGGLHIIGA